ncbi:MAG: hypothetical protein ACI3VN_06405 [Candidatus Onthomonas sp.]
MLQYPIHLTTIQQFRKYASFTYHFPVTGYVKLEDARINLSFLHELMCHCPIRRAELVLTTWRAEDLSAIENDLVAAGVMDLGRYCPGNVDKSA